MRSDCITRSCGPRKDVDVIAHAHKLRRLEHAVLGQAEVERRDHGAKDEEYQPQHHGQDEEIALHRVAPEEVAAARFRIYNHRVYSLNITQRCAAQPEAVTKIWTQRARRTHRGPRGKQEQISIGMLSEVGPANSPCRIKLRDFTLS